MKQGVFGGTFDPPHIGHLLGAQSVLEALSLECIRFVLASLPPHKPDRTVTDASIRLAMLRSAIASNPFYVADARELNRSGPSYTVDTLRELHREFPGDEFTLIIGGDNVGDFHLWKNPDEILALATVVVMERPGFVPEGATGIGGQFKTVKIPLMEISSSEIRRRVREGRSVRYLVREEVEDIIRREKLYR